jgi:hypothetical protein
MILKHQMLQNLTKSKEEVQNRDYVEPDAVMVVTLPQESRKERSDGDHDPC